MNYILAYWEEIESGRAVTSRRVQAVYERLARAIWEPDPDSPYRFDEEAGERPILFTATASIFEALASDSNTLDGLNSHSVIIDELHAISH